MTAVVLASVWAAIKAQVSPDGSQIMVYPSGRLPEDRTYLMNADGTNVRPFVFGSARYGRRMAAGLRISAADMRAAPKEASTW
jgi:hypothetical protein